MRVSLSAQICLVSESQVTSIKRVWIVRDLTRNLNHIYKISVLESGCEELR